MLGWFLFIAGAYLAGSVPFGLILGRLRGVDLREHGSKNIGATNAGRVLGRKWGALCFVLDVLKGADWIVDLGPEGGDGGGTIVASGTPEDVAKIDASHTGRYLRTVL